MKRVLVNQRALVKIHKARTHLHNIKREDLLNRLKSSAEKMENKIEVLICLTKKP